MTNEWQVWLAEQFMHGLFVVLRICIIVGLAYTALRFIQALLDRFSAVLAGRPAGDRELPERVRTIHQILRTSAAVFIWTLAGVMVLKELGIAIGPILAGAGIAGLALGFGAQTLVKDMITGLFILIEDQFRVGDVVRAGGHAGKVEKITLRTVWLRDAEGVVHILPFGSLNGVENLTHEWRNVVLDIGIAYRSDLDRAMEAMGKVLKELVQEEDFQAAVLEPPEVLGVQRLDDSAVVLRAVLKTTPDAVWTVRREALRRIKQRFDEESIEIPYPQMTVWLSQPEPGAGRPTRKRRKKA